MDCNGAQEGPFDRVCLRRKFYLILKKEKPRQENLKRYVFWIANFLPFFMSFYDRLLDMNNLYKAFLNCKKGTAWKASTQRYEANLLYNLNKLRKSLIDGTYIQKPFYEFDISERGKKRHIKAIHISDRVLQRALCDEILIPELSKYLIYDNGASQKGKGTSFTRKRLEYFLHKHRRKYGDEGYVLKLDIRKYFDSIPHDKLIELFSERIKDERVLKLISYLINTFPDEKGVGLGAQISQIAGIFFLYKFDNYVKIVLGIKFYLRYMDDCLIIHISKKFLKKVKILLKEYLKGFGLDINSDKTQVIKLTAGFTFLKTFYRKNYKRMDKSIFYREYKKAKSLPLNIIKEQYKGWSGNYGRNKVIEEILLERTLENCLL